MSRLISELPEPFKLLALQRHNEHCGLKADEKANTEDKLLVNAFIWNDTPEGYGFWLDADGNEEHNEEDLQYAQDIVNQSSIRP